MSKITAEFVKSGVTNAMPDANYQTRVTELLWIVSKFGEDVTYSRCGACPYRQPIMIQVAVIFKFEKIDVTQYITILRDLTGFPTAMPNFNDTVWKPVRS